MDKKDTSSSRGRGVPLLYCIFTRQKQKRTSLKSLTLTNRDVSWPDMLGWWINFGWWLLLWPVLLLLFGSSGNKIITAFTFYERKMRSMERMIKQYSPVTITIICCLLWGAQRRIRGKATGRQRDRVVNQWDRLGLETTRFRHWIWIWSLSLFWTGSGYGLSTWMVDQSGARPFPR